MLVARHDRSTADDRTLAMKINSPGTAHQSIGDLTGIRRLAGRVRAGRLRFEVEGLT